MKVLGYSLLFFLALLVTKSLGIFMVDFSELYPEISEKFLSLGSFLFFISSLIFMGQAILKWGGKFTPHFLRQATPVWRVIFHGAIGSGFFSFILFIGGWALPGPLKPKLAILLGLLCLAFIYGFASQWEKILAIFKFSIPPLSKLEFFCLLFSFTGFLLSFVGCFSPITYYDSLVYHLGLPSYYLTQNTISAVPFNLYSFFPAHMEMLFLFILDVFPAPEYVINLLCLSLSVGIGLGIYDWVLELEDRKTAFLALFLWWTMPAVLFLSFGAYVDIALAFFIFSSIKAFHLSQSNSWGGEWLALSGLLAGIGAATKYTGLICPFLIFLFLIYETVRSPRISLKKIFLFCASAFIPLTPWLIRNYVSIGNPVFPFAHHIWEGHIGWTQETAESYFNMLTEYGAKSDIVKELIQAPWKISTEPMKFGGGFDVLGDFGWPIILFLGLISPVLRFKDKTFFRLCLFYFGFAGIWFMTKPVLRFLVGVLPIAVLMAAVSLQWLFSPLRHHCAAHAPRSNLRQANQNQQTHSRHNQKSSLAEHI